MMGEVIRVSGRAPDVGEFLREAMLSQRFADVTLCCPGGQRFLAHRLVLSAASPYLQEVLLAHSKATSHCEPITVILAEVEAPELAAILGFVYTGSATVPRPRLDAFLGAAEALRIGLPPVPIAITCDAKDVQVLRKDHEDLSSDVSTGSRFSRRTNPRRHVANRVTDSPWRQIVRPHHSPKIQPMILRHYNDENELNERLREPESSQQILAPQPIPSPKIPYPDDFQVPIPNTPEPNDFYVRNEAIEIKPQEIVQPPRIPPVVSPKPPGKPEISHPVSRLCDTLDTKEEEKEDKSVIGIDVGIDIGSNVKNSDDNNNNNENHNEGAIPRQRPREEHRCDQCGKSFVTRASLKVHGRTHSGEKPFRCADCGKQFSQLRNYKYHRSVHEGTREFAATCPECGKYFNDRGYLSSHMKIHRNRKEYGCAECGKSFNQRVAYNMHVRIHTGVKPHQCEQCGKAFSRKMLLKQHLRTHSGERPYRCQVCQKAFADRSNMTLHTRLHSGLKPYQCTLCSKAFTKKHHLKTHLNYHTGTKPYSCPNCNLRFSQSSNMRTHFKKCSVNNPNSKPVELRPRIGKGNETVATGTTEVLTPPNSDQESNVVTPISRTPIRDGNV